MIKHKVFIKYWKLPELKGLTVLEAGKKIMELEGRNKKYMEARNDR